MSWMTLSLVFVAISVTSTVTSEASHGSSDFDRTIALVSAMIAGVSVIANFLQALSIHRLEAKLAGQQELESKLEALQAELHRSMLFQVSPNLEIWELGIPRLNDLAALLSKAEVALSRLSTVPTTLYALLHDVFERVRTLRLIGDRYWIFKGDRTEPHYMLQTKWPEWAEAVRLLEQLQPRAADLKREITNYLPKR